VNADVIDSWPMKSLLYPSFSFHYFLYSPLSLHLLVVRSRYFLIRLLLARFIGDVVVRSSCIPVNLEAFVCERSTCSDKNEDL